MIFTINTYSQSSNGIVVGKNIIDFNKYLSDSFSLAIPYPGWNYSDQVNAKSNFHIGYFYSKHIVNHFKIEIGLDFSTKGVSENLISTLDYSYFEDESNFEGLHVILKKYEGNYDNDYYYLDFNTLVQRQILKNTWIEVGGVTSLNINNKIKFIKGLIETQNYTENSSQIQEVQDAKLMEYSEFKDLLKPVNFAFVFGIKQFLNDNFFVRFRTHFEIDKYPQNIPSSFYDLKRHLYQFSAGFTF